MKQTAALVFWAVLMLAGNEIPAQAQIVGRALQAGSYAAAAREGYREVEAGNPSVLRNTATDVAIPASAIAYTTGAAAVKGAGRLAGYAGVVVSAVSNLGPGGVTTAVCNGRMRLYHYKFCQKFFPGIKSS